MARPLTLVLRLWYRSEGLRAEVKQLKTGETEVFKSAEALLEYFERTHKKAEANAKD